MWTTVSQRNAVRRLPGNVKNEAGEWRCRVAPRAVVARASPNKDGMAGWLKQVGIGLSTAALISLSLQMNPAGAALTSKHPVDSGSAILANALPIDNKYMRDIQENLEGITEELNSPTAKSLAEVSRSVRAAQSILVNQKDAIKESFVTGKEKEGERSLEQLSTSLNEFTALLRERQKDGVSDKQREALNYVAKVDEAMVSGVPYKIPQEFAHLPALKGRSTLEMKVHMSETPDGPKDATMKIVVDGYNAPLSAGSFVDLALRKFYDGMEIQRADGFVVQTGNPDGDDDGFRDPKTKDIRRVPMEVAVVGDKEIVYNSSLEDLGRSNESVKLLFNAYALWPWLE